MNDLMTLGEVKALISDPNYVWKDKALCIGRDTESFIRNDLKGKNILKEYKAQIDATKINYLESLETKIHKLD